LLRDGIGQEPGPGEFVYAVDGDAVDELAAHAV
jgi:hypothetical protein